MAKYITLLIVMLFLGGVLQVLVALFKQNKRKGPGERNSQWQYQSRKTLMTLAELQFFRVLEPAVGEYFRVFSKVRLADIIQPVASKGSRAWYSAFASIKSKHVDFVLCDADTMEFRMVVELDDKSHQREDRMERDIKVDGMLTQAGIPVAHFPVRAQYSVGEIQGRIFEPPAMPNA